jgi:hypothetical protein
MLLNSNETQNWTHGGMNLNKSAADSVVVTVTLGNYIEPYSSGLKGQNGSLGRPEAWRTFLNMSNIICNDL